MRIEVLGSGGATTTPRPGCSCRVCTEARRRDVPYSRTGPSVFVHDAGLLIDTPEESKDQLVRAGIRAVPHATYSHWHPDHTLGRRVFETLNFDFRGWPFAAKASKVTQVHLPEGVAEDFERWLAGREHLDFLEQRLRVVEVRELRDGDELRLGPVRVRPFRLAVGYVYAFLLEQERTRVLVAMDELHGWEPPGDLGPLDLAILPMGICEHDPFTGERSIHPEHPLLEVEATFAQTLDVVRRLDARRVVLSHVEETEGLGHDDLARLAAALRADGLPVEFAHDGLVLEA